jgi:arginine decarboxylase
MVYRKTGNSKPSDIITHAVGKPGELFLTWLKRALPSVPLAILTNSPSDPTVDANYISKDSLNDEAQMANKLSGVLMKDKPMFWSELLDYSKKAVTSWHTPGHNKGAAFASSTVLRPFYQAFTQSETPLVFTADLSVSVDRLGDLSDPVHGQKPMAQAMKRAADVFGSARTYFCTNGSSSSNKTLLMTLLKPGEVVLIDRNCHKSVHQAVVMAGAIPFYLTPRFNPNLGLWRPLSLTDIEAALEQSFQRGLQPRLLVLTTCTYDGVLFPVHELAEILHQRGVLLQADEAWFPYGRFHPYYGNMDGHSAGRYNALDSNADFSVHSSHKALAAFSQASMLHIGNHFRLLLEGPNPKFDWIRERFGTFDQFEHRLVENLSYWLSTSPHYPMIASLDASTAQMSMEGGQIVGNLLVRARKLRAWAAQNQCEVTKDSLIDRNDPGYAKYGLDPLKFTVSVKPQQMSALREKLEAAGHQWEKATERCILFLLTTGSYEGHVEELLSVLSSNKQLLGTAPGNPLATPDIAGQVEIIPFDAHYATGCYMRLTEITDYFARAKGRQTAGPIACHMVTPYPPGVPTILPGLRITPSVIDWIKNRGRHDEVHGLFGEGANESVRVLLDSSTEYKALKEKYRDNGASEAISKLSPPAKRRRR